VTLVIPEAVESNGTEKDLMGYACKFGRFTENLPFGDNVEKQVRWG
jgi:hypothetical protein